MTGSPGAGARPRLGPGREFDLIRVLTEGGRSPPGVVVGPGDDCAVLEGGLVLTCDMVVEGIHFRREWLEPEEIGYRAAAAALSDLAAMAAEPRATLVSYALPAGDLPTLARALHGGVEEACHAVGTGVVGGDVTRSSGPLVVDVIAVGRTSAPVLRSGAEPGDELWVTGRLGGAAAALELLLDGRVPPPSLRERFARPRPRVAEARWLADRAAPRALIDLSDGLAGDAGHVAAASAVTLVLEAGSIPLAPGVAEARGSHAEALRGALSGGEDYELLLACPPGVAGGTSSAFEGVFGLPLTRIGRVQERGGDPVLVEWPEGSTSPPDTGGFDHFAAGPAREGPP